MIRSPIALFVYNRLAHTVQTVEALKKNYGASQSSLHVFSDGAKNDADIVSVDGVRKYVNGIKGFADVRVLEREQNLGLASSIITGVTDITSQYDRVVVLEDDIVTSPYFLTYMNDALDKYQDNEQVMHIAGYMLPIKPKGLKETFFYRNTSCWGWGTWKRAWAKMEEDTCLLKSKFTDEMKYRFNIDGTYDSWGILERQCAGKIDSWAIRWYASVFLSDGLCLHTSRSITKNIGHDASGIHCGTSSIYDVKVFKELITDFEEVPIENSLALKRIKRYLLLSRIPSFKMLADRLIQLLTGKT
jgi:hypothetical protein